MPIYEQLLNNNSLYLDVIAYLDVKNRDILEEKGIIPSYYYWGDAHIKNFGFES